MNRRALLAAPLLAPTLAAAPFAPTSAAAQATGRVAMEEQAWFKTCQFQVTPEIDRALMVKGFLVSGVTLI